VLIILEYFYQTKPNQTKPNQTKPNQTKPNQTKPNLFSIITCVNCKSVSKYGIRREWLLKRIQELSLMIALNVILSLQGFRLSIDLLKFKK
jgi:hypothetical protein